MQTRHPGPSEEIPAADSPPARSAVSAGTAHLQEKISGPCDPPTPAEMFRHDTASYILPCSKERQTLTPFRSFRNRPVRCCDTNLSRARRRLAPTFPLDESAEYGIISGTIPR